MNKIHPIRALCLLIPLLFSCGGSGYSVEKVSNTGGSAVYEIFVGEFADSNGDGLGDLNGITNHLDYLESLGVSYLWLTPIHPSKSYHKYDVDDYYGIDSKFGTLADFDHLVAKAKEHHIGILLDMVFNHCSIYNPLYTQFFDDFKNGNAGGHAYDFVWSKTEKEGYHYFSQLGVYVESRFSESMPEFDLTNPYIKAEQRKIQEFWLHHGVAGFRYDAVGYYFYGDASKNVAYMKTLVSECQALKPDVYQVGEAWPSNCTEADIAAYQSSGMRAFNFPTSENNAPGSVGYVGYSSGITSFVDAVVKAQTLIKEAGGVEPCFFVSNHDQSRWGNYYAGKADAEKKRKLIASCYLLTPGTPFLYYGEELEMLGTKQPTFDHYLRQAMRWGESTSDCQQPEGYTFKGQVTTTVSGALKDGWSFLNHYRKVLSIRNKYNDFFRYGTYEAFDLGNTRLGCFKITYNNKSYFLVHSNSASAIAVSASFASTLLEDVPSSGTASSLRNSTLTVQPYSSVWLG
jgi:alpha-amylase